MMQMRARRSPVQVAILKKMRTLTRRMRTTPHSVSRTRSTTSSRHVRFEGTTGLVDFYDASADADRLHQGDRRVGISYLLLNYVSNAQTL
eukprot:1170348-Prymnesium_polylepis.1